MSLLPMGSWTVFRRVLHDEERFMYAVVKDRSVPGYMWNEVTTWIPEQEIRAFLREQGQSVREIDDIIARARNEGAAQPRTGSPR